MDYETIVKKINKKIKLEELLHHSKFDYILPTILLLISIMFSIYTFELLNFKYQKGLNIAEEIIIISILIGIIFYLSKMFSGIKKNLKKQQKEFKIKISENIIKKQRDKIYDDIRLFLIEIDDDVLLEIEKQQPFRKTTIKLLIKDEIMKRCSKKLNLNFNTINSYHFFEEIIKSKNKIKISNE